MAAIAAPRPTNCGGSSASGAASSAAIQPGPLITFQAKAGETYRLTAVPTLPEVVGAWLSLLGLGLTALLWFPGIARLRSVRDTPGRGT